MAPAGIACFFLLYNDKSRIVALRARMKIGGCTMKWLIRLLATSILTVCVVLSISLLPQLENDWDSPVFNLVRAEPLTELNVVDVMSKLQLHLRIRKVEVSHAIVSVDLLASPSSDRLEVLKDVSGIPQLLFSHSSNINQVLVRVLDGSKQVGGSTSLLIAADARREKMVRTDYRLETKTGEEMEQYLQSHYRMTFTPNWREKFEAKSSN